MYILHHGHDDGRDDHGHGDHDHDDDAHDGGRGHDRDSRMCILHHGCGDVHDVRVHGDHDGGRGHDRGSRMYILHHGRGDGHDVRGHGAHDGDHGRDDDAFLLQEVFQQNHCLFPLHVRFLHHQCHPMLLLQLSLYHLSREAIPMFFQVYLHSASVYG